MTDNTKPPDAAQLAALEKLAEAIHGIGDAFAAIRESIREYAAAQEKK